MHTKPHITYISCVFPPYKGGIGNVCFEQSQRIAKKGFPISVITPHYRHRQDISHEKHVHCLRPLWSYGNAAILPQLAKYLKGTDIIHFHYPFLGTDLILVIIHTWRKYILKRKTKLIVHYHMDLIPPTWIAKFVFAFSNRIVKPLLLALADRVIVTSEDYGKHSQIHTFIQKHPHRIRVISNGVDTIRFYPENKNESLMKQFGIGKQDRVILFVGGLDESHFFKGLSVLVYAVSQLPAHVFFNLKVVVVGDGNLREGYEAMVHKMGLDHVFVFTGSVSDEVLPQIYRLANFLVLPSINQSEAFGMVLIEAMASEIPVITSDLPGVRSVVDNEQNGMLVPAMDTDALKEALYQFLTDPLWVHTLGYAGLKKVKMQYDWNIITDQLESVYKELV